jgi:hypothetical protein
MMATLRIPSNLCGFLCYFLAPLWRHLLRPGFATLQATKSAQGYSMGILALWFGLGLFRFLRCLLHHSEGINSEVVISFLSHALNVPQRSSIVNGL